MANYSTWEKYLTTKDLTDVSGFDGATTNTNTWLTMYIRVGAKQVLKWGRSGIVGGVDNRGVMYLSFKDNTSPTPVQVEGKYRIGYMDANMINKVIIQEGSTSEMHNSKTARDSANVLGVTANGAGQDSYLFIDFLPDTASKTMKIDNCDIQLPITILTKTSI